MELHGFTPDKESCPHTCFHTEKILEELKRQNLEHFNFRKEYTREIIDLVKVQQINVGPNQQSLQTLPYLKGKAKTKQIESIKNKKRKK